MAKFIVFEGLDGTGKTTQIRLLADYLKQKGEAVFTDVEPSGLPTGRFLRQLLAGEFPSSPWATAALFLADRINQNTDEANGIKKHLAAGNTVLLDRYYYSTFAYQGNETDLAWAMDIHFGCPEITKPDLTLFLTMAPEQCLARITANRAADEMEIYETLDTLTAVSRQFDTVFSALKDRDNIMYINADGTVEEVHARIVNAVEAAFPED